jgi:hypothetical protein
MMEAIQTYEKLVRLCQTTRYYNPKDSHLHTHRRENLKSYLAIVSLNNTNQSIFVMDTRCVFSEVKTEFLNTVPSTCYCVARD